MREILAGILGAILMSVPSAGAEVDSSPTFHHDNQRTGRTQNSVAASRVLLWSFRTGGSVEASPVIGPGGTVYLASSDGKLYAFSPEGDLLWTFLARGILFATPAIGRDGTIYLADISGRYYAVKPDGTQKWVLTLTEGSDRRILTSPVVAADGQSYIGGWNNYFYAVSPEGAIVWRAALKGLITAAPALDPQGSVYVATLGDAADTPDIDWDDNQLTVYKFHSNSSDPVWKFSEFIQTNRNRILSSPAIDVGAGRLYVGASRENDGILAGVDLASRQKIFASTLPRGIVSSPALGADGTIYVGCLDGSLYALDPAAGVVRWRFESGSIFILGSPTIDGSGNIYIGDSDGVLHAVSPTGLEVWHFAAQANVASAPVINEKGSLFFTSFDSHLYTLGAPTRRYWRERFNRVNPGPSRSRP